jgi:L-amino acid N-acyltransferase YncA
MKVTTPPSTSVRRLVPRSLSRKRRARKPSAGGDAAAALASMRARYSVSPPYDQPVIRHADPARDAAACATLYAPFVEDTVASFEDVPPTAAELAERMASIAERFPWLVLEEDGRVAGFAYASQHRTRAAYRWAVDVAVYVDPAHQRRGGGRRLYEELFDRLRGQRYRTACAGIALPNDASLALHQALGFEHVGTYRSIGWKAGAWRDVSWWQLSLLPEAGDGPPAEPLGPGG